MTKKIKIYMGIPSLGTREDAQVYILREIEQKYAEKVELVYPNVLVKRIFHDFARNAIVEDFLKSDCDLLWFLDSDVVPPGNILDIVVEHYDKWQAAGAPYPIFMTPAGEEHPQVIFTVYRQAEGKGMVATQVPLEGTDFVDGIATGCIFLKREVLEGMSKPYFEFEYDKETREMTNGEDIGFCKKLSERGIKFFIDFSKVCDHYKKVGLLQMNNYAILRANNSVIAFHRGLRQELAKRQLSAARPKSGLILP
jgi:hypothetical protein